MNTLQFALFVMVTSKLHYAARNLLRRKLVYRILA